MNTIEHWAGPEGDAYHARQTAADEAITTFFERALLSWEGSSIVELGCGDGRNLRNLRNWDCSLYLRGIDINPTATLRASEWADTCEGDISDSDLLNGMVVEGGVEQTVGVAFKAELAMTRGVLIHVPPAKIQAAYENLYALAETHILIAEYYNPTPVEVPYRGKQGLLWKRDFAGEMLDRFGDLELVEYGFQYRRGPHPQDDVTWFLLRKT